MNVGLLLSCALGFAISSGSPIGLAISILTPVVFLRQSSRGWSYCCAVAYYLAALHELPLISRNFFGPTSGITEGIPIWIMAACLLSAPWAWAWSASLVSSLWRCPAALLLSVVPPLGIIGLASPTAAAGLLFPGTGFAGFVLTLLAPAIVLNSEIAGLLIASVVLLCHLSAGPQPQPPPGWAAVNITFGPVGHGHVDLIREYQIARQIESAVSCSRARVVIFPEAVAPIWIGDIVPRETTILVGAVEPIQKQASFRDEVAALTNSGTATTTGKSMQYQNKILVRGSKIADFAQRVPIPIGMWKPFTGTGEPLNIYGPGTIQIDERRAAVVICYEQLIAWPILTSMLEHPSVIVAVSNNAWLTGTAISHVKRITITAWARLFNMPLLSASNQ